MIVNDLLQSLSHLKMYLVWSPRLSMIFYKASDVQICYYLASLIVNDLKTLGHPKIFLFGLYDRQWSLTKPRLPKNVSCLISMIVNDLLKSLGRPNIFLFDLYDLQWSLAKPRSPKYNSLFDLYDRHWSLAKPRSPNMFFIWSLWSLMISYKASVAQKCVSFILIWSSMIFYNFTKPQSLIYVFYLFFMIGNDLLQSLGRLRLKMYLVWSPVVFFFKKTCSV